MVLGTKFLMLVCLCKRVTSEDIKNAINDGATTVKQVIDCTCAGTCCGTCVNSIKEAIQKHLEYQDEREMN